MVFGPGFAVGGFVFADNQNRYVGLTRGLSGSLHALLLGCRVDEMNIVSEPAVPVRLRVGDLAAFRVDDVGLRSHAVTNALQDADAVGWFAAVAAQVNAIRVGADHGDGLE